MDTFHVTEPAGCGEHKRSHPCTFSRPSSCHHRTEVSRPSLPWVGPKECQDMYSTCIYSWISQSELNTHTCLLTQVLLMSSNSSLVSAESGWLRGILTCNQFLKEVIMYVFEQLTSFPYFLSMSM